MKTRTAEDYLREMVGDLVMQQAVLRAKVEELEHLLADALAKAKEDPHEKDHPA